MWRVRYGVVFAEELGDGDVGQGSGEGISRSDIDCSAATAMDKSR